MKTQIGSIIAFNELSSLPHDIVNDVRFAWFSLLKSWLHLNTLISQQCMMLSSPKKNYIIDMNNLHTFI